MPRPLPTCWLFDDSALSNALMRWCLRLRDLVLTGLTLGLFGCGLAWAALILYGLLAMALAPPTSTLPAHLQFTPCPPTLYAAPTSGALAKCSHLYANVTWRQMADESSSSSLSLRLTLPGWQSAVGNVMACVRPRRPNPSPDESERCRLLHIPRRGDLGQALVELLLVPLQTLAPLLAPRDHHTLDVVFYEDDLDLRPGLLQLDLELKTRHLDVVSADFVLHPRLSGLQYYQFHYPWTSASVGLFFCITLVLAAASLAWRRLFSTVRPSPVAPESYSEKMRRVKEQLMNKKNTNATSQITRRKCSLDSNQATPTRTQSAKRLDSLWCANASESRLTAPAAGDISATELAATAAAVAPTTNETSAHGTSSAEWVHEWDSEPIEFSADSAKPRDNE